MKTRLATLAAAFLMASGYSAFAQAINHNVHHMGSTAQAKMAPMALCKQMMADMAMEKSHMKDMDAKLDGLVSTMDSASGDAKVNAMSAVVTELISQRKMMRSMKAKMDAKMMDHMMAHKKMPMKSGKMQCPMMKGMMGG